MSKLRDWRHAKGLTQDDLAKKVGTTGASISRIEVGEQWPSAPLLIAIERATKGAVKTGDILTAYQAAQQLTAARRRRGHAQAAE